VDTLPGSNVQFVCFLTCESAVEITVNIWWIMQYLYFQIFSWNSSKSDKGF